MRNNGAPPEVIEAARKSATADECLVWPENKLALDVFCAMGTQWRFVPMGMAGAVLQGLDYSALPFVMRAMNVPASQRKNVFEDLQVMERAALDAMEE